MKIRGTRCSVGWEYLPTFHNVDMFHRNHVGKQSSPIRRIWERKLLAKGGIIYSQKKIDECRPLKRDHDSKRKGLSSNYQSTIIIQGASLDYENFGGVARVRKPEQPIPR